MRNDFYVGMYEDQYLSHTMTPRELDYELSTPAATDALDPEAWLIKTGYQAYKKHKKK